MDAESSSCIIAALVEGEKVGCEDEEAGGRTKCWEAEGAAVVPQLLQTQPPTRAPSKDDVLAFLLKPRGC
jgi:hypothetical protein